MLVMTAWLMAALVMVCAFGVYCYLNNPGVVDVAWSLAIAAAAFAYTFSQAINIPQVVFALLVMIWASRLAGYLLITRVIPGHVEKRYEKLSEGWQMNKRLAFFANYQFQAFLALIVASPFYFISQLSALSFLSYLAMIVIIIGILGESIADWQLQQFRNHHAGEVCNVGLWRYSRHPNYFFDWCAWLGFALAALAQPYGFIALMSPALLLFIMLKITGPITEQGSLDSRGDKYRQYQSRTSMFFPWLPRS